MTQPDRNWTEDFSDENGNYYNTCLCCDKLFRGHKRRVYCKVCSDSARLECLDCHCKGSDVAVVTCPFSDDISNKVIRVALCKKCYHQRCDDI